MPSGRTHDRITLWSLPLIATLAFKVTADILLTLIVSGGFLFGGFMFGPDLDIHSVQYKRWGWFRWIWIPYRGSMRHRSMLSHGPIMGTTLRVLYLSLWLGLLGIGIIEILNSLGHTEVTWTDVSTGMGQAIQTYIREWIALLVGIELGALSHYLSDWLVSALRRSHLKQSKKSKRRRQRK